MKSSSRGSDEMLPFIIITGTPSRYQVPLLDGLPDARVWGLGSGVWSGEPRANGKLCGEIYQTTHRRCTLRRRLR
jgi:hypothetical protein